LFDLTNELTSLSHLLIRVSHAILTVELYLSFYRIYRCLVESKKQFLSEIIMNNEIWTRCDRQVVLRIVSHWTYTVFVCSTKELVAVRPFSLLLCQLNHYFPFPADDVGTVTEIRSLLKSLLLFIAQCSFDKRDFDELVNQCVWSQDIRISSDLLGFIKLLILDPNQILRRLCLSFQDVAKLPKLCHRQDVGLSTQIIDVITEFFRRGLLGMDVFPTMIELLAMNLRSLNKCDRLFQFILDRRIHGFVSLACWYATVIDPDSQAVLIERFSQKGFPPQTDTTISMFWPLVMALQSSDPRPLLKMHLESLIESRRLELSRTSRCFSEI
jgi:hypothetical protein